MLPLLSELPCSQPAGQLHACYCPALGQGGNPEEQGIWGIPAIHRPIRTQIFRTCGCGDTLSPHFSPLPPDLGQRS